MPASAKPALFILFFSRSPVGQKEPDFSHVALFDQLHLLQGALTFPGLAGQDVTVVRL
jgi:hypothetical protein